MVFRESLGYLEQLKCLFRFDTGFIKSLAAFWINGQRLDTPQHVNNTKYVYLD